MSARTRTDTIGPFRADQLQDGDRYELHRGHPIYVAPSGPDQGNTNLVGGLVIETDTDVEWAGVEVGFSPEADMLHAPDVSVAPTPANRQGWVNGVPALALEYASSGQDEGELKDKIANLLERGTAQVWVVRLIRGPSAWRGGACSDRRGGSRGARDTAQSGAGRGALRPHRIA